MFTKREKVQHSAVKNKNARQQNLNRIFSANGKIRCLASRCAACERNDNRMNSTDNQVTLFNCRQENYF